LAWFIFQVAGNSEKASALLEHGAKRLSDRISEVMAKKRTAGAFYSDPRFQKELTERLAKIATDAGTGFGFGIAGGQVLKKGGDISVNSSAKGGNVKCQPEACR
jgi:hypothetical protein